MVFKCPKWFVNWVTESTIPPGAADPEIFNELIDVVSQHTRDLSTLNTGFGRIERKQQRWIEILNLKEAPDNGGLEVKLPPEAVPRQEMIIGAETMDLTLEP